MKAIFKKACRFSTKPRVSVSQPGFLNFNKYLSANINQFEENSSSLNINLGLHESVNIQLDASDTIQSLKGKLSAAFKVSDVKVYSDEQIEISNQTKLSDIELEQIYIQSDARDVLIKVVKPAVKLSLPKWNKNHLITDYKDFKGLYLPYLYQQSILNFLGRLNIDKDHLTNEELINEILARVPNARSSTSFPMSAIDQEFEYLYKEYCTLEKERTEALAKGQRYARRILLLGFIILGGQIALVVFGVYVYYNWDIMEPIMYFLQYAGVLILGSFFFIARKKYENQIFSQWIVSRYQKRCLDRSRFDHERYRQVVQLLKENHKNRLKTILSDF